jgi:hypothetical protein
MGEKSGQPVFAECCQSLENHSNDNTHGPQQLILNCAETSSVDTFDDSEQMENCLGKRHLLPQKDKTDSLQMTAPRLSNDFSVHRTDRKVNDQNCENTGLTVNERARISVKEERRSLFSSRNSSNGSQNEDIKFIQELTAEKTCLNYPREVRCCSEPVDKQMNASQEDSETLYTFVGLVLTQAPSCDARKNGRGFCESHKGRVHNTDNRIGNSNQKNQSTQPLSMLAEEIDSVDFCLTRTISGLSSEDLDMQEDHNGVTSIPLDFTADVEGQGVRRGSLDPVQSFIFSPTSLEKETFNSASQNQENLNSQKVNFQQGQQQLQGEASASTQSANKDTLFVRREEGSSIQILLKEFPEKAATEYAAVRGGKYTPAKVRFHDTFAFKCGLEHKFTLGLQEMVEGRWCESCDELMPSVSKYIKKKDGQLLDEYLSTRTRIRCVRGHTFTLKPAQ